LLTDTGANAAAVVERNGALRGVLTQQQLLRAMLQESELRLREITQLNAEQERLRMVGQMAAGVLHNLNNSLMPLETGLEQLENICATSPAARSALNLTRTAAGNVASLVGRLAKFLRARNTPARAPRTDVNLVELLHVAVAFTEPKWLNEARRRGATVRVSVEAEPVPRVFGDEGGLLEVLVNLVFNAVDAMPQGGDLILSVAPGNGHAVVEVRDSGIGMSEEQRLKCMTAFYTTKGAAGSGLGLSVSQDLLLAHGSGLEIQSEPGMGATVRFALPYAEPKVPMSNEAAPRQNSEARGPRPD
jgi:signal transduction histidine kinase